MTATETHDGGDAPTVLVVDDYVDAAHLYATWLSQEFSVRTAYDGREALDLLDQDVSVVLLDRKMPNLSGEALLVEIRARGFDCRVAAVTGVEPDFDLIEMPLDAYLQKPVDRTDLLKTVRTLHNRAEYDERLRTYCALASRKAVLETEKSSAELAQSEAYARLEDRIRRLAEEVDAIVDDFDPEDFEAAFRNCVAVGDEAATLS